MASTESSNSASDNTQNSPLLPDIDANTPDDPTASAPIASGSVWQMVLCKVAAAGTIALGGTVETAGEFEAIDPLDGGPLTPLPYLTFAEGKNVADVGQIAWRACDALNAQPPVSYSMGQQDGGKGGKKCKDCKKPSVKPVDEEYLRDNGIDDPHQFKRDQLGEKAKVASWDIVKDTSTNEILLQSKDKQTIINTGEYFK